jgi:lactoylglutathione lyase family protein
VYPATFSHVGVTVPFGELERAVAFYRDALGLEVVMGPTDVDTTEESLIGVMCRDVFGAELQEFRIAHLYMPNQVGLEIFEFPEGRRAVDNFQYRDAGIFHMAFCDPNLEERVERIVALGGKRRMAEPRRYYPDKPNRMIYMEDPFGNVIELYSHDYRDTYAQGGYK